MPCFRVESMNGVMISSDFREMSEDRANWIAQIAGEIILGNIDRQSATSRAARKLAGVGTLFVAFALAGCAGPTYGTGKASDQQLVEDLTGILSLGPKERQQINYQPRPGIVMPPSAEVLPPPQENVASTENPAWPESPEQRLARVRAEATANQGNRTNIVRDVNRSNGTSQRTGPTFSESGMVKPEILGRSARMRDDQRLERQRRQQQAAPQGSPNTRRYLSDPPVDLRQPSATAPAGDLGKDEYKKERERKKAANTGGLRKLLPWLN